MKQLMDRLGLDIPKWEGPTLCETSTSESIADVKPPHGDTLKEKVKKEIIKVERKREATQEEPVKEEAVSVKRERADSSVGINENK